MPSRRGSRSARQGGDRPNSADDGSPESAGGAVASAAATAANNDGDPIGNRVSNPDPVRGDEGDHFPLQDRTMMMTARPFFFFFFFYFVFASNTFVR